jgi:hypothetical protein
MANIQAKLRKVTLTNETLLQFCERKVKEKSKSIRNKGLEKSGYDDWIEAFNDLCDDYLLLDDTLFKVLSMKEDEHFLLISHNADGTIDIAMDYHDGASTWQDNFDKSDIELLKK